MRSRLSVLLAIALVSLSTAADSRLFGRGGVSGSVVSGNLNADFVVTNNTGSTVANGYRRFWHPFVQGDIPAGTAPIFKDSGGDVLPYSAGAQVYWPGDGSLMGAMFLVCKIPSTANTASQTISIFSGGTWPAASSRSLTEVYNQQLTVTLTAASITGANMSGFTTIGAWIDAPGGDANVKGTFKTLSGGCGEEWKIEADMSLTQGSAAHGQLVYDEYITALDDGSGSAAGFLHLGKTTQPWYNVDSPAKNVRAFSSASWAINPGGGGVVTQAYAPLPADDTFSWSSSDIFAVTAVGGLNPFYFGAASSGGQVLAGRVSGGSLPAALDANTLYSIQSVSAGNLNTSISTAMYPASTVTGNAGSGTFTPLYIVCPMGSLIDATTKATSWFFQGTGSLSADPRLDWKPNKAYWAKSRALVIIPNLSESTVTASTFAYNWQQASIGPTTADRHETGFADYGWLSPYGMRWFMVQSPTDEKVVRILGLSAALEGGNFRDSSTRQLINPTNKDYAGGTFAVPSHTTTQQQIRWSSSPQGSWTPPAAQVLRYVWSDNDCSHCLENGTIAYMVSGEAYQLDLMNELAVNAILHQTGDANHRNPDYPVQKYGIATGLNGEIRDSAHSARRVIQAAAFDPVTYFDGSALKAMWTDIAKDSFAHNIGTISSNNSYVQSVGLWMPIVYNGDGSFNVAYLDIPWQTFFFGTSAVGDWGLLGDTSGKTLAQNMVTRLTHFLSVFNGWDLTSYVSRTLTNADAGGRSVDGATAAIGADAGWMPSFPGGFTWTSSSPAFSWSMDSSVTGYTPAAGDQVNWYASFESPAMTGGHYTPGTNYFLRDVTNSGTTHTFNLAATNGGTAIAPPTNSGTIAGEGIPGFVSPQSGSVTSGGASSGGGETSYVAKQRCLDMALSAHGILALDNTTPITAVLTDANNRMNAPDWNANPAFDCQATFP